MGYLIKPIHMSEEAKQKHRLQAIEAALKKMQEAKVKIYLIYDLKDQALMTIQEAYDARQKFEKSARESGKLFTYDLYAGEEGNPGHLYQAGAIFDRMEEVDALPRSNEIDRALGIGPGVDLAKIPTDQVDRETFFFRPKE